MRKITCLLTSAPEKSSKDGPLSVSFGHIVIDSALDRPLNVPPSSRLPEPLISCSPFPMTTMSPLSEISRASCKQFEVLKKLLNLELCYAKRAQHGIKN